MVIMDNDFKLTLFYFVFFTFLKASVFINKKYFGTVY